MALAIGRHHGRDQLAGILFTLVEQIAQRDRLDLAGRLGPFRIVIFENPKRGQDGEPDWVMHLGEAPPWKQSAEQQPERGALEAVR